MKNKTGSSIFMAFIASWSLALTTPTAQTSVRFDCFYPQDAFLVPIAQMTQLQTLLDLHKVIRLEPGDYKKGNSLSALVVKSNYRIYGIATSIPNITIEPGTENAVISSVHASINFPTSTTAITRHNLFRRITYGHIAVTNAMVEDNLFTDISWNGMDVDTRQSGYFRNNRILRFVSQIDVSPANPVIRFRGDLARKSGGNVFAAGVFLGSPSNYFDNQYSLNLLCPTNESYSTADDPFMQSGAMGKFTIWQAAGLNSSGRSFISNADESVIYGFDQNTQKQPLAILGPNQAASMYMGSVLPLAGITDQATAPFRVYGMDGGNDNIKTVSIDGKNNPTSITTAQAEKVRSMLMKPQGPAWEAPVFNAIANPGGVDWSLNRDKKTSSSTEIQARINAEGLVILPKGIYYLDKPLILGRRSKGLLGAGQDQTVLIAMRPDMNLIEMDSIPLNDPEATGLTLTDLTLQGGKNGIFQKWRGGKNLQFYDCLVSNVTFRDMSESGLQFTEIYAWDNNIFDDLTFYKCASGFKQHTIIVPGQNDASPTLNYMDKVTFQHCRFVECGKALDMLSGRACGGNWFMNCRFEGNSEYVWRANHYPINFLNCDFIGNAGSPVVHNDAPLTVTGCRFENGVLSSASFVNSSSAIVIAESNFKGAGSTTITPITPPASLAPFLTNPDNFRHYRERRFFIYNSVSSVAIGGLRNGMLFNNSLEKDTVLAKEWVNVIDSVSTVLMADKAHPAAQLLVGAIFPGGLSSGGGTSIFSVHRNARLGAAKKTVQIGQQIDGKTRTSRQMPRNSKTQGRNSLETVNLVGKRIVEP